MKTKENERKNKFYKTNPSGISLIVLVITIIVIIILATAIIVTLLSNNPINEANKARFENDRDSMQAIFTNTVAKVMAQKQATMDIKAGSLNTVTSGVSSATGDANYTLNGVVKEEEINGRIIFDNKENTDTEYYTGKQLPIYKSGETTWYVDEEGIISLKVGDKIYGDGKIVNGIKITAKVVESEEFVKDKVKVRIEVAYEDELQNVIFNNETITSFERQEKLYIVEREVTKNGTYEIVANGENGATSKTSIEVNQIENLNSDIQIKGTVTPSSDYVKATMGIEITLEGEVESITINGESIAVPSKSGGKYVINKSITANGEYKVEVKAKDGTTNKVVINIDELADNMEIWNRADMEKFRDKVNKGATYSGKTVTVMDDINLGSSRWTPIANYGVDENLVFKGIFEGNNKTISGLYINNTNMYQGLFGYNNGEIRNIKISGSISQSDECVGAIAGSNMKTITNCHSSVSISNRGFNIAGGIAGYNEGTVQNCSNLANIKGNSNIGGIVGNNGGNIKACYNKGKITALDQTAGGIVGYTHSGRVYNCYNIGAINANLNVGGINGAAGVSYGKACYTYNSYNLGSITGNANIADITGYPNANGGTSQDKNCYADDATVSALNRGSYSENVWTEDINNINRGYPVLKWQL